VGESIAALREVTPEWLAEQTCRNFFRCFRLNEPSC
jgi:Tat protein secretion system quality control protein TatD with DNase activity